MFFAVFILLFKIKSYIISNAFVSVGTVTSADFDITLMVCLIRNAFNVTPPKTGWNVLPNPTDVTEEADITRIKYYRNNYLAHLQTAEISNSDFNKASTDVRKVGFQLLKQ